MFFEECLVAVTAEMILNLFMHSFYMLIHRLFLNFHITLVTLQLFVCCMFCKMVLENMQPFKVKIAKQTSIPSGLIMHLHMNCKSILSFETFCAFKTYNMTPSDMKF